MCCRYISNTEDEINEIREILKEIAIRVNEDIYEKEIYPSYESLVYYKEENNYICSLKTFGFRKWNSKSQRIVNARSENLSSFFKNSKRCLVSCKCYFEWDSLKRKHTFYNDSTMYMAGLLNEFNEFVILTKNSLDSILDIHPRMPLILEKEHLKNYLDNLIPINNLINCSITNLKFKV